MSKVKTIFRQVKELFAISRNKSEARDNYKDICMQFAEYLAKKRNTTKFLICRVKPEEVQEFLREVAADGLEMSQIYWCALKTLKIMTNKYFGLVNWEIPEDKIKLKCPYCGASSKLIDSKIIYGRSYGMFYVCVNYPECDAYVGTHQGTTWPRGTLANKELREYRKKAYFAFDSIQRSAGISRTQAYKWLAKKLNIPFKSAHIGYFDLSMCQKNGKYL
ncbi:Protein of unknown function [Desulfotomaculum arcticum]|uniref:Uncharacterized protein n=1 Tax=Desulfotruncus arcticus DSM 17038 TaxID=1121424 RepID=A0A1I2ZWD7_9FIRM|nr:zinc-finger-containing protein [Desulfotruncus arcticus]SFH42147.1 Protein of unknown function [Desulfotomaculum arcticum] [Desulfotruncus arcticus DSM 17038]